MVELIEEIIEAEAAAEQAVSFARADAATQKQDLAERHALEIADAKSVTQQGAKSLIESAKTEASHLHLEPPEKEFESFAASHAVQIERAVDSIVTLILRSEIDIGPVAAAKDRAPYPTSPPADVRGEADVGESRSG